MPMRRILPLLMWLFALPLAAQQPTHPCAGVVEPAARLACYDGAFPPPPEVGEAAAQRAHADFGLVRQHDSLRNPGQMTGQSDPERIESRVAKVNHASGGQRGFHLENGQVWTQTESSSLGHVRAGDLVQVRKGLVGGYQLVTLGGVALRVRRAR